LISDNNGLLTTGIEGNGTGTIVLNPAGGIYAEGTQVTVSVISDNNSEFVSWSGSASDINNPLVITMDGDKNIVALINKTFNETNILGSWNGDFELGNILYWRALEVAGGVALSIENDNTISSVSISNDFNGGIYASQFTWGVNPSIADIVFDLNVPVLPQTDYIFKASAKSNDPCILRIHCTFYNSSGAILGDYNDVTWQLTGTYQQHEWVMPNSPLGSAFAVVGFRLFNTDGSRWPYANITTLIDDVQLLERIPISSISGEMNNLVTISENVTNESFGLKAYPNPFKLSTTFSYELKENTNIRLSIYDIAGSLIEVLVEKNQPKGEFKAIWNRSNLQNGIYFVRLESNYKSQNIKIILSK